MDWYTLFATTCNDHDCRTELTSWLTPGKSLSESVSANDGSCGAADAVDAAILHATHAGEVIPPTTINFMLDHKGTERTCLAYAGRDITQFYAVSSTSGLHVALGNDQWSWIMSGTAPLNVPTRYDESVHLVHQCVYGDNPAWNWRMEDGTYFVCTRAAPSLPLAAFIKKR